MEFALSQEERLIRDAVREFADGVLRPGAQEWERRAAFPRDLVGRLAEAGLLGMVIPARYGGSGLTTVSYCLAMEEIARACASTAVTVSVTNSVCAYPLLRFGTEEQKNRFLPRLARGEILGGFCLTEPGAGSDAAGIVTRYRRDGDRYLLNGVKSWVTNARIGSLFLVLATRNPAERGEGISAFLVDSASPGFTFGKLEDKLGLRASATGEIRLEECAVPAGNLLGEEGRGLAIALHCLTVGRIGIAAQATGIAGAALEVARRYARERRAFGRRIAEFQAIQFMLADMATLVDAARLLTLRAASLRDQGSGEFVRESSMAKLFASEAANRVTYLALQVHGGYGYSREFPVERYFRDARATTIYEGSSEIQRMIIARQLLGAVADGIAAEG
ncbi:MAG: acyl-CoA dehydrogenase family protein [Acidobacteria bacterium]|nr:acyl-CoA dehydrogenase family protein [Acidobacteriota bacterium]